MDLDHIDHKILRALQEDGRLTNVALAERVGLSPSPCLRRVRLLEKAGVIAGYRASLDREKSGLGITIYVSVKCRIQPPDFEMPFIKSVLAIPQVIACHLVSGKEDFLLEVVVPDTETYERNVLKRIMAAPGMRDIQTNFVMRSYRIDGPLPI